MGNESATFDADDEFFQKGLGVRRAVLGEEYVEQSLAQATDFTRDFQIHITRSAWGEIWSRPGLDRATRSIVTLSILIAQGQHEELALHTRGALTNGVTRDQIKEILLHASVYSGVPAANEAVKVVARVFEELDADSSLPNHD